MGQQDPKNDSTLSTIFFSLTIGFWLHHQWFVRALFNQVARGIRVNIAFILLNDKFHVIG